jgi:hypothetical protein
MIYRMRFRGGISSRIEGLYFVHIHSRGLHENALGFPVNGRPHTVFIIS